MYQRLADSATPGPWEWEPWSVDASGAQENGYSDTPGVANFQHIHMKVTGYGVADTYYHHIGDTRHGSEEDAIFISTSRTAVPALVAAVYERDGIIHDLQQDSLAYQRGKDDGRREYARWVGDMLLHMFVTERKFDAASNTPGAFSTLTRLGTDHPLPLPPDQVRAESHRLRKALENICNTRFEDRSHPEALDWLRGFARETLAAKEVG
jgi:hypothetical protein